MRVCQFRHSRVHTGTEIPAQRGYHGASESSYRRRCEARLADVTSDLAAEGSVPVEPTPATPPRKTRGTALNATLIVVAQSTQAIAVGAIALFLPLIRADLGLSFSQAGLLAAAATLSYALMQVPAGILSDRMSPKVLFGIGLLGTNALAIVFALSDSYSVMLVTQAVAGIFRALMFIPGCCSSPGTSPRRSARPRWGSSSRAASPRTSS